jgi:hypothetical protein
VDRDALAVRTDHARACSRLALSPRVGLAGGTAIEMFDQYKPYAESSREAVRDEGLIAS